MWNFGRACTSLEIASWTGWVMHGPFILLKKQLRYRYTAWAAWVADYDQRRYQWSSSCSTDEWMGGFVDWHIGGNTPLLSLHGHIVQRVLWVNAAPFIITCASTVSCDRSRSCHLTRDQKILTGSEEMRTGGFVAPSSLHGFPTCDSRRSPASL